MSITYINNLSNRNNYNNILFSSKTPNNTKKAVSQRRYDKISDIITQVKQTSYLSNFMNNSPYNINNSYNQLHQTAFTPINKRKNLFGEDFLLPQKSSKFENKKTLVLDIDETLVHSSFIPFEKNDLVLNINIDGIYYNIYILIRPWAEQFIKHFSKFYEIITFTASIPSYASPLLDIIDKEKNIQYRLYREHCTFVNGIFIKDLKKLNRNLKDLIIVDNSPLAYAFDSDNGLPILSWFDNPIDRELKKIQPLLEFLSNAKDVRKYIKKVVKNNVINYELVNKIIKDNESKVNNDMNNIENNYENDNENNNENNNDNNNDNCNEIVSKTKKKRKNINKNGKRNNSSKEKKNNNDDIYDKKFVNNYINKKEKEMPLLIINSNNSNIVNTFNSKNESKPNYLNQQISLKCPELDNNNDNNNNNLNKNKNNKKSKSKISKKKNNVFKLGVSNSNTKNIDINNLINNIDNINKNQSQNLEKNNQINNIKSINNNSDNINNIRNNISLPFSLSSSNPQNLQKNKINSNRNRIKNEIQPLPLKELLEEKINKDKQLKYTNLIENIYSKPLNKKFQGPYRIKRNCSKKKDKCTKIPSSSIDNNIIPDLNENNSKKNIIDEELYSQVSKSRSLNFMKSKNVQTCKTLKINTAKIIDKHIGSNKWFKEDDNKISN